MLLLSACTRKKGILSICVVVPDQELLLDPEPYVVQVSTLAQLIRKMAAAKQLHGQAPRQCHEHGNLSEEAGFK